MKFVFSDKNRSINAFLNFLYFGIGSIFILAFSYSLTYHKINGWPIGEIFEIEKFYIFMILGFLLLIFPIIFKKIFILKIFSGIFLVIALCYFYKSIELFLDFSDIPDEKILLFLLNFFWAIFLFMMARFKEKYFQNKS